LCSQVRLKLTEVSTSKTNAGAGTKFKSVFKAEFKIELKMLK